MLVGRSAGCKSVENLLIRAKSGHSGALVVRGEAGIGKSALLDHAREFAEGQGFQSESLIGVESETQFAFAGLHQLCAPLMKHTDGLPEPQRTALHVAFGEQEGPAPDHFLVGLAMLNLLAETAESAPLLCLIDDAQWLDQSSAQILAFVGRRISAERIALVFAQREPHGREIDAFAGLPELVLEGLSDADARALLTRDVRAPLDERVTNRIIAEARGNPLALLELPHNAPSMRLAGGFELPDVLSVPRRIEEEYRRRSAHLPPETQRLMLVAAAEPLGDVALLMRAAGHLGVTPEAAEPAEAAGLLEIDTRVRFGHPLARSAVYQAAPPPDRRRAHAALAAGTDRELDPDRTAWHCAQAVLGADESAAAELERSAGRARARGGLAAAGAFLQQATTLTPGAEHRARRALEAAHAKHEVGADESALELLAIAEAGTPSPLQKVRIDLLRAQIRFHQTRAGEVPAMLLDAAQALAPLDARLSRETYLAALDTAIITSGLDDDECVPHAAQQAATAPSSAESPRPVDLLLDGLVTTFLHGYEEGASGLHAALLAFRDDAPQGQAVAADHRWLWLASRIALALFDQDLVRGLAERNVRLTREAGALASLPEALLFHSAVLIHTGEIERAEDLAAQVAAITEATGAPPLLHAEVLLAAWGGREQQTVQLCATIVQAAQTRDLGTEVSLAHCALALLHNGLGNYAAAAQAAERACRSAELAHTNLALLELIEAAARADLPDRAAAALERLEFRALASGSVWALGLLARSRALVHSGSRADGLYQEAIELLGASGMTSHLGRTHLIYGEWLRREGRRQAAREQLRTAHALLSRTRAGGFVDRAARELRSTGEHPRRRSAHPTDLLTAQELQVSRLVATGATSREVGAQLFLSTRTIEAHLRNIFRKLGITSRRQLRELQLR